MVCLALGEIPEQLHFCLLHIQVACCGLFCIRLKSPEQFTFCCFLIKVACCGLFCIRLKSPEQLHFVAYYSSGMLWFVMH